ncbi:ABC-type cobalt transport system, ATPase component [Gottschalkia purinilytica]|uniref:ABC-type cobalt transport system, ATPase component n=1 Tax=Gottschalkia purinilytica TaxID=1503 RepID=A0A0L0W831_GOTPU|nr:ABC transporter ATP-binding protein [Gottschalkia purinilytica]KNF07699.1 ABC-type cobalt transport system, ATPase component [Gottschalkia purinilytica]
MIELDNVSFRYKNVEALSNINIKINKGDSVAIIGSNGSGKSTLLKLLNGLVFSDRGRYTFEGIEINEKIMNNSKFSSLFHKKIGFIFQNSDSQLFCPTVYDEIAFGPRQMNMNEENVDQRVKDCLELFNIEHLMKAPPYNLSEGEKKKVAIASVLSLNPNVLVLDEPTNNLDPRTKNFLKDILIKLNFHGKTIICATHDFEYL